MNLYPGWAPKYTYNGVCVSSPFALILNRPLSYTQRIDYGLAYQQGSSANLLHFKIYN